MRAAEQDRPDVARARQRWRAAMPEPDPDRLVFVDETWASTNMTRRYGRSPRGERLVMPVPHGHWKTTTFVAGLRAEGLTAPTVVDGAMTGELFEAYVRQQLVPALTPGDVVVMDNLACHKWAGVRRAIESAGARLLYLPAYSPDFNPIEAMFSKLKEALRSAAGTVDALIGAMGDALRSVTPGDILGWFHHCGYRYRQE